MAIIRFKETRTYSCSNRLKKACFFFCLCSEAEVKEVALGHSLLFIIWSKRGKILNIHSILVKTAAFLLDSIFHFIARLGFQSFWTKGRLRKRSLLIELEDQQKEACFRTSTNGMRLEKRASSLYYRRCDSYFFLLVVVNRFAQLQVHERRSNNKTKPTPIFLFITWKALSFLGRR